MIRKSLSDTNVSIVREVVSTITKADVDVVHFEVARLPGVRSGPFILVVTDTELLVFALPPTTSIRGSDSHFVGSDLSDSKLFRCIGGRSLKAAGAESPVAERSRRLSTGLLENGAGPIMRWELRRIQELSLRANKENSMFSETGFWATSALMVGNLAIRRDCAQELVLHVCEGVGEERTSVDSRCPFLPNGSGMRRTKSQCAYPSISPTPTTVRIVTTERGSNLPTVLSMMAARTQLLEAGGVPCSALAAASQLDAAQRFLASALEKLRACDSTRGHAATTHRTTSVDATVDAAALDELCELLKEVEVEALTDPALKAAFVADPDFEFLAWLTGTLVGFQSRLDRAPTHRHRLRCFELLVSALRCLAAFLLHADTAVGPNAFRLLRPAPLSLGDDVVGAVSLDFASLFDAVQYLAHRQERATMTPFASSPSSSSSSSSSLVSSSTRRSEEEIREHDLMMGLHSARSASSSSSTTTSSRSSLPPPTFRQPGAGAVSSSVASTSKAAVKFASTARLAERPSESSLLGQLVDAQATVLLTLHSLASHFAASSPLDGDPEAVTAPLLRHDLHFHSLHSHSHVSAAPLPSVSLNSSTSSAAAAVAAADASSFGLRSPLLFRASAPLSSSSLKKWRVATLSLPPSSAAYPFSNTQALVVRCAERCGELIEALTARYRKDWVDAWLAAGCPCPPLGLPLSHRAPTTTAGNRRRHSGDNDDDDEEDDEEEEEKSGGSSASGNERAFSVDFLANWVWDHSRGLGRRIEVRPGGDTSVSSSASNNNKGVERKISAPKRREAVAAAAVNEEVHANAKGRAVDQGETHGNDDTGEEEEEKEEDDAEVQRKGESLKFAPPMGGSDNDEEAGDADDDDGGAGKTTLSPSLNEVASGGGSEDDEEERDGDEEGFGSAWEAAVVTAVHVVPRRLQPNSQRRRSSSSSSDRAGGGSSGRSGGVSETLMRNGLRRTHRPWGLSYSVRFLKSGRREFGVPPEDLRPFTQLPPLLPPSSSSSSSPRADASAAERVGGSGSGLNLRGAQDHEEGEELAVDNASGVGAESKGTTTNHHRDGKDAEKEEEREGEEKGNDPAAAAGWSSSSINVALSPTTSPPLLLPLRPSPVPGQNKKRMMAAPLFPDSGGDGSSSMSSGSEEDSSVLRRAKGLGPKVLGGAHAAAPPPTSVARVASVAAAVPSRDGEEEGEGDARAARDRRRRLVERHRWTPRDRFDALEMQIPSRPWMMIERGRDAQPSPPPATAAAASPSSPSSATGGGEEEEVARRRRKVTGAASSLKQRPDQWWRNLPWNAARVQVGRRPVPLVKRGEVAKQSGGGDCEREEQKGKEAIEGVKSGRKGKKRAGHSSSKRSEGGGGGRGEGGRGGRGGGGRGGEAYESEVLDCVCGGEVALYHLAGLLLTLLRAKPDLVAAVVKETADELWDGLCSERALRDLLGAPTHAQLWLNRRTLADLSVVSRALRSRILASASRV